MDCKHIPYTSVNQYTNGIVFYVSGTGEEILTVLEYFPTAICISVHNIKQINAVQYLETHPSDIAEVYIIFNNEEEKATLFKLKYI